MSEAARDQGWNRDDLHVLREQLKPSRERAEFDIHQWRLETQRVMDEARAKKAQR